MVYSLGIRGISGEGRSQNLAAIGMAAHTLSSFAFILHVFAATHTKSAFSLTLHRPPLLLSRCTQRLSVDTGLTDSIGAPAWLPVVADTPSSGQAHCWRWAHLFARARLAPWVTRVSVERPSLRCSCKIIRVSSVTVRGCAIALSYSSFLDRLVDL